MCGIPQKAAATRFPGLPGKVLNKVIHRHAGRLQLFSGIQNLAPNLKFYFKFATSTRTRVQVVRTARVAAGVQ